MISKSLWEKYDEIDYITRTKRVTITPNLVIYHIEESEVSNSVLRNYKDLAKGYFLRVNLQDEKGEPTKNLRYISHKIFKPRVETLTILNRDFKLLAFSSS